MIGRLLRWLNRAELLWLTLLTPLFYFPSDGRGLVILALPLLWLLRKGAKGYFLPATPVNGVVLLLLAMSGVGLAVSFDPDFSFPYVTRLLLGIAVFFALADIPGRRGVQLSLLALVGAVSAMLAVGLLDTRWPSKIPQVARLAELLPTTSLAIPGGSADTFNANIIGGISLFIIPLLAALLWPRNNPLSALVQGRGRLFAYLGVVLAAVLALGTLLLSQSRGAYLGLTVALLALLLFPRRWLLIATVALGVVAAITLYATDSSLILDYFRESDTQALATSVDSLEGRMEVWSRAIYALEDFPFTGVGMGLFRQVMPILYPLFTISPNHDIGHAHNQFLAAGTDLGLPGMIAYLALWLLMGVMLWQSWHSALPAPYRRLTLGLAASLTAHFTWSLTDTIVLGARGHLPFWLLLASIVTLHRLAASIPAEAVPARDEASPVVQDPVSLAVQ